MAKIEENVMKSLQEDIKNQDFKHVYLFCGEEDYLKQQYKKKMRKHSCRMEIL